MDSQNDLLLISEPWYVGVMGSKTAFRWAGSSEETSWEKEVKQTLRDRAEDTELLIVDLRAYGQWESLGGKGGVQGINIVGVTGVLPSHSLVCRASSIECSSSFLCSIKVAFLPAQESLKSSNHYNSLPLAMISVIRGICPCYA